METNIRKIVKAGNFPTTREKAIELINSMNAIREIEEIRKEDESNEKEKSKFIGARRYYIKPIFEMDIGSTDDPITVKKVGPTIWKEVVFAQDEMEAKKYIQKMADMGKDDAALVKAENMMVIGTRRFKKMMKDISCNAVFPIINFRAFSRKGYRILSRTYIKPPVRALAKPVTNFI
jgi:hypothetical protein